MEEHKLRRARALKRPDQKNKAEERLEKALLGGLASGPPIEADRHFWERKRRQLLGGRQKGTI